MLLDDFASLADTGDGALPPHLMKASQAFILSHIGERRTDYFNGVEIYQRKSVSSCNTQGKEHEHENQPSSDAGFLGGR